MRGGPQGGRGPSPGGYRGRGGPSMPPPGMIMGRGAPPPGNYGPPPNYPPQERYGPSQYGQPSQDQDIGQAGRSMDAAPIGQAVEMDATMGIPSPAQSPGLPNE
jgi:hypothetical protein